MPFINTKVNVPVSPEKTKILKALYAQAITNIPGKTEARLMLCFEENCNMYFYGQNDMPIAMVEVSLFGSASNDACNALTAQLCDILSAQLDIEPKNIFVKYISTTQWGNNGANF